MSTDIRFRAEQKTRPLWRRLFLGFFALLLIAVLAVAISSLSGRNNQQTMHPDSVSLDGAGALAAIMEDRGVTVEVAHSTEAALASGGTILVWDPNRTLSIGDRADLMASGGRLVVVSETGRDAGDWWRPSSAVTGPAASAARPECSVAWLDGITTVEGISHGVTEDGCFPVGNGHHLVVQGNFVYFASPELFINDQLDRADNAAVAVRALAATDRVTWLMPEQDQTGQPTLSVVPPALTGALIGFILAAIWYGLLVRRPFGPLIPEKLPVVVPSAESARGRARLYERGANSGHAGAALRAGMIAKHAGRFGLPSDATPDTVTARISEASGWEPDRVHHLLYGPPPSRDGELIELAHGLDTLSKELYHD